MHCAFSSPIGPAPVQCATHTVRRIERTCMRAASVPQPSRYTPGKRTSIVRASALEIASPPTASPPLITITDAALKNLKRLREDAGNEKVLLRMGVRSGGCSGMSYHMDFEDEANVRAEDMVMEYEGGFKLVCDPKSGLYLFGMRLDYSSALIGGGFQFHNPNAASSCGCGKSFGV
ncbi:hypothetical protein CVIRNUC_005122 [Coccomyxa viridis]|uniref:Core domain-containing protein n=1 Tax=Coccomyxa viridis TaxID=1274662 RepID=A0AAV1I4F2_9CHLO|nr:hypothetical protein CVIRNUC_005122 [Coccomyxa viridis]